MLKMLRNASNSFLILLPSLLRQLRLTGAACSPLPPLAANMPRLYSIQRLRQNFDFASGAGDLLLRRFAERVGMHGKRNLQFAVAQDLDAVAHGANDAPPGERFRGDRVARGEDVQALDIHHRPFVRERAREAALGQAAVKRHLPALEARTARIAATRLLTLVAGSGGLAHLGTHAAADAHLAMARAARRLQLRQCRFHALLQSFFGGQSPNLVRRLLRRVETPPSKRPHLSGDDPPLRITTDVLILDFDQVVDFRDHAANRRRVLTLDHLLHAAESEATNRLAHIAGAADEAADPFDFQRA